MELSYEALLDGELAAIVTFLEMRQPPRPADREESTLRLRRVTEPEPDDYRALFRKIGAPWLWFSRLAMSDAELHGILGDPAVELYEVTAVEQVANARTRFSSPRRM